MIIKPKHARIGLSGGIGFYAFIFLRYGYLWNTWISLGLASLFWFVIAVIIGGTLLVASEDAVDYRVAYITLLTFAISVFLNEWSTQYFSVALTNTILYSAIAGLLSFGCMVYGNDW